MRFPTETIIDYGQITDVAFMVIIMAIAMGLFALWTLLRMSLEKWSKVYKRKKSTTSYRVIKAIVSITTLILMTLLIFHAKDNFNIENGAVDLEQEENSFRLLEGEIDMSDSFDIEDDKLYYMYRNSDFILPNSKELGTIKIENGTAIMTPTSSFGITFVRYGNYVQNNPGIIPEQTLHEIDVENEEIELTIYDDNFETYEKLSFDAN